MYSAAAPPPPPAITEVMLPSLDSDPVVNETPTSRQSNSETSTMLGLRDSLGLRRRRLITSLHSRPSFREREAHQRVHMRRVGGRSRGSRYVLVGILFLLPVEGWEVYA